MPRRHENKLYCRPLADELLVGCVIMTISPAGTAEGKKCRFLGESQRAPVGAREHSEQLDALRWICELAQSNSV